MPIAKLSREAQPVADANLPVLQQPQMPDPILANFLVALTYVSYMSECFHISVVDWGHYAAPTCAQLAV